MNTNQQQKYTDGILTVCRKDVAERAWGIVTYNLKRNIRNEVLRRILTCRRTIINLTKWHKQTSMSTYIQKHLSGQEMTLFLTLDKWLVSPTRITNTGQELSEFSSITNNFSVAHQTLSNKYITNTTTKDQEEVMILHY